MSESSTKNRNMYIIAAGILVLIVVSVFYPYSFSENEEIRADIESHQIDERLEIAVEDLNAALPQRQGLDTYFDSVALGHNHLNYYYTFADISMEQVAKNEQLEDSLYSEAEERIPCSLWRPDHMNGVSVTFTYFSNDGEKILEFERIEQQCQ